MIWRFWSCPRTLESAARDFVDNRNPPRVRAALADPESWTATLVIDWKRRIASTYGLARTYGPFASPEEWSPDWKKRLLTTEPVHGPAIRDGSWSGGWNRELLANAGHDPEVAAENILKRVSELAKLEAGERN